MRSVYKYIFLFTLFVTGLAPSAKAAAPSCASLFEKQVRSRQFISGQFDTLFSKWINTVIDEKSVGNDNYRYKPEDYGLTRWQFLNTHMTPHFRNLVMQSRPEFFKDQILPSPLELTEGMKRIYRQKNIPRDQWILPGLALENIQTKEIIYKTYDELIIWPKGFKIIGSQLGGDLYDRALHQGVLHILFTSDIDKYFDVHVTFHDLNHLASLTEPRYLKVIREFNSYALQRIKNSTRPESLSRDLFGIHVAYDLLEEYWYVPQENFNQLNAILAQFKNEKNETLTIHTKVTFNDRVFTSYLIPNHLLEKWQNLVTQSKKLNHTIFELGFIQSTKISDLPPDIRLEKQQLIIAFQEIYRQYEPIINQIENFYSHSIVELGGAVADQFSTRAQAYAATVEYSKAIRDIRYGFTEGLTSYGNYTPENFANSLTTLIYHLVNATKNQPDVYLKYVLERADRIY